MKNRLPLFFLIFTVSLYSFGGPFRSEDFKCYQIQSENTPEAVQIKKSERYTSSIWCYSKARNSAQRFVFNADAGFRAGLAALIEVDSNDNIKDIVHGSLNRGVVRLHRMGSDGINPLGVPLLEERLPNSAKAKRIKLPARAQNELEDGIRRFTQYEGERVNFRVTEGTFEQDLSANKKPFDAYWWPHQGVPLASGPMSPLGKYDAYVKSLTGTDPKSSAWELQVHSLQTVEWGGHCNGWAASAVLYRKTGRYLWDSANKTVIYPSDIDGMLSEASFCVHWAFYGRRNYGEPEDDPKDIYPDKFHKVIVYYFDHIKKPVALDYFPDLKVDNNVISGYKMVVTKDTSADNKYKVVMSLQNHDYNRGRIETVQEARKFTRTYSYTLEVDASGNIVGGTWSGTNPDFLWVPLEQKDCGRENPNLKPYYIEKMRTELKEARVKRVNVNYSLGRVLKANEKITLPIGALRGTNFRVHISSSDLGSGVYLIATGFPAYTTTYSQDVASFNIPAGNGASTRQVYTQNIDSLVLWNSGSQDTTGTDLKIDWIEYVTGE